VKTGVASDIWAQASGGTLPLQTWCREPVSVLRTDR